MIIVACIVIGVLLVVLGKYANEESTSDVGEVFGFTAMVLGWFANMAFVAMVVVAIVMHLCAPGFVASNHQRYDSLVHQAESGMYDNDNDFGKKELANQIQEWNEDLAVGKTYQHNFWVGVFYPNVYDEFEYIPMEVLK